MRDSGECVNRVFLFYFEYEFEWIEFSIKNKWPNWYSIEIYLIKIRL